MRTKTRMQMVEGMRWDKLNKIKQFKEAEGYANVTGDEISNGMFYWFVPQNENDIKTINENFALDYDELTDGDIGKVICIEESLGGDDAWVTYMKGGMDYVKRLFDKLGYDVEFVKREEEQIMDYRKILIEKVCKEREQFRKFYFCKSIPKAYNDYYRIFFFEQYHAMLTNDYFLKVLIKEEIIKWLSEKDSPITFLYTEWLNTNGYLSENWDDMTEFIGWLYTECMESEV